MRIGALLALLAFITSLPQLYLCFARGTQWNGSCAYLDTDELAYSAYVNALIDGRPRRNDPYTGNDNSPFETLFSSQFLPAYAVALPARVLHLSASTSFIILQIVATVLTAFTIMLLLFELTRDLLLSSIGAVGVVCLGTVTAVNPVQLFSGANAGYDLFAALRRYVPAVPFPLFIGCSLFAWRALTRNVAWAILCALTFAILIYSYFFLWTAAAAWLVTFIILWFIGVGEDRGRVLKVAALSAGIGIAALLPYAWLLMHRSPTLDQAQLLKLTHSPDLLRGPEIFGAVILVLLFKYTRKRAGLWHDRQVLLTASFVIAPFVVFNQQIITGRSLQPFHYEEFVTNYWSLLSVFLVLNLYWRNFPRRIHVYIAIAVLVAALFVGFRAARRTRDLNTRIDKGRTVALYLRKYSNGGTVFASDIFLTHSLPSTARNSVLWARHLYAFSNVSLAEQKLRYFQYLYYCGFDDQRFAAALRNDYTARWEVFGADRVNPVLTGNYNEITENEIKSATRDYAAFVQSFNSRLAESPTLSYAVVSAADDISNLDKWYERSEPEIIGDYLLYSVTLRRRN